MDMVQKLNSRGYARLGVTNAESDTVTENAAEVPKEAILTEVESTAASEEPRSVTAEATPPALEPAPTAVTPSPSPAVAAQITSPAIAEETPSATAEATPPAVEPVPIAAAPSPTPAVAEPTPLPVIAETTPPPAATKPTSPTAETVPAPPPSPSRVAENNRPFTVSKVSSLSHDEVIPNDLGKHVPIKLVDIRMSNLRYGFNFDSPRPKFYDFDYFLYEDLRVFDKEVVGMQYDFLVNANYMKLRSKNAYFYVMNPTNGPADYTSLNGMMSTVTIIFAGLDLCNIKI
ncbi:uncharacterized protein LOC126417153 [Schistocerca serialis cubense]|uniref:uncharacterized protein LOC126417153 n=1 Tax=Schistocerca serialis cubense TaxID=2023355 RepID=UPI00214E2E7D|nr:uncharacterized protein LOC126417153 [Schistocerca serialis cubense]